VTFFLFVKQIGVFARKDRSVSRYFNLIIYKLMSRPFCLFRTLPKVYGVSVIFAEKGSDSSNEQYNDFLKEIDLEFKDLLAAVVESVITIMSWVSLLSIVGIRPMHMVISSASINVIFIVWI